MSLRGEADTPALQLILSRSCYCRLRICSGAQHVSELADVAQRLLRDAPADMGRNR